MMKEKNKLQIIVTITYIVVFLLALVFSVYMICAEHISVYQARTIEPCEVLEDYIETTVEDSSAPAGVRIEYRFALSGISTTKNYLAFYIVHSYADVCIDGELVYSLAPNEYNRIGKSPSSNWIFIPVDHTDNGCEVKITLTPVYKGVVNCKIEFMLGSRSDIELKRLRTDFPQIVLSLLCIFIGVVIMVLQPIFVLGKKLTGYKLFYLGNFLLLIGIWRITDTRFSPILFYQNTMALGYVTLASLLICNIPILLFFRTYFTGRKKMLLLYTAFIGCIMSLIVLICQIFQIAELRETLSVCHIMLIISMAVIALVSLVNIEKRTERNKLSGLVMMVFPAAIIDLLIYYWKKTSSGAMFTILALLIYTVVRFIAEIFNIDKKVYIDAQTGLFNRSRWNDLMEAPAPISEATGVMMLDLNRLKYTNDAMGHEMGDRMIIGFADILRGILPSDCMIFRWGGDEFTVLVYDADLDKMNRYVSGISEAVKAHNLSGEKPEIHFAAGFALSTDYPTLSCEELMKKADEKMYNNKREWYHKNFLEYHL